MKKKIRDKILDYDECKGDVERWLRLRGEEKYSQFAKMLENEGIDITWKNILFIQI